MTGASAPTRPTQPADMSSRTYGHLGRRHRGPVRQHTRDMSGACCPGDMSPPQVTVMARPRSSARRWTPKATTTPSRTLTHSYRCTLLTLWKSDRLWPAMGHVFSDCHMPRRHDRERAADIARRSCWNMSADMPPPGAPRPPRPCRREAEGHSRGLVAGRSGPSGRGTAWSRTCSVGPVTARPGHVRGHVLAPALPRRGDVVRRPVARRQTRKTASRSSATSRDAPVAKTPTAPTPIPAYRGRAIGGGDDETPAVTLTADHRRRQLP